MLAQEARQGRRIFLDTTAVEEDDLKLCAAEFAPRLTRKAPALYELEAP